MHCSFEAYLHSGGCEINNKFHSESRYFQSVLVLIT